MEENSGNSSNNGLSNDDNNKRIKRKKTATISFRMDSKYEQLLRNEAEEKKVSLNTLANQIFGEHLEWQRYIERFGTIVMSKDAFKLILEFLSEEKVIDLAISIASKVPKEFILFKWKDLNSDNVINFVRMFFGHCGYGQYDYIKDKSTNKFSIRHELGRKGSLFLTTYIKTVVKSTLGKDSETISADNSITVSFRD
ncbi:MAG: hypothetical protein WBQ25_00660 [Nitrososphaeraceae archaeon]